jgi:hypothetical protein
LVFLNTIPIGVHGWSLKAALFVIGFGVAIPWGLMDNLAVSVVPKEKAGVAIGIFGALRVSFDSTAIAIVGSLLALFMSQSLIVSTQGLSVDQITAATAQLAAGAVDQASKLIPTVPHEQLVSAYEYAFHRLIEILIVLTTIATILIFVLLYRAKLGDGLEITSASKETFENTV